ncbi:membrane protein insertase YidC [bacterium]|nr:membrane protein insertase YidC [bacterium]
MKRIVLSLILLLSFIAVFGEETKPNIIFENDIIKSEFTAIGGKIKALYFKKYKNTKTKEMYNIIDPGYDAFPLEIEGLDIANVNQLSYDSKILENGISFTAKTGNYDIKKEYLFEKGKYFVNISFSITNNSTKVLMINDLEFQWGPQIASFAKSKAMRSRYEGDIYFIEKKPKRHKLKKKLDININEFKWLGYHSRYFTTILLKNNNIIRGEIFKDTNMKVWFSGHFRKVTVEPGDAKSFEATYYIGPQSFSVLKNHGNDLNKIVNMGFFGFLTKFILLLLNFLVGIFHNYGIAIIIITLLIKLVFLPLSNTSIKSMKKMAELQPELKKMQALYKDNPQKLNEETMKLYKLFKVNPLSGCLPMLIQLPFFWAIYSAFSVSIDLRGASFFWWIKDLSAPDTIFTLFSIPINVLPILMGVAMFIQQEVQGTQQSSSSQAKYMKFLPLMFLFFFWNLPSGLVLYWLTNNILTIVQTLLVNKKNEKKA